ncbi:Carbamoyl-phosphate synthase small chain [hydrothermal vent metagenome]|uniref:carbamoyl-phosphate synthase (glutamine-hydrolyzing) n=1 Tax=hydrothermal vent metagenome TaxID=652676 RepID=A0A3B1AQQ7_9ZZZZ
MSKPALLALADGTVFHGQAIGIDGQTVGEVVFNTAMSGYQEILTDPSYAQQLVTLTYPHIGNVGVNSEDAESTQVHVAGLVIRDLPIVASSWRAEQTLGQYLIGNNVVAIANIDTRQLTRLLREKGAQSGCIVAGDNIDEPAAIAAAKAFPGLKGMDLAKQVTTAESYKWTAGCWDLNNAYDAVVDVTPKYKVVAFDFGIKHNILRLLAERSCDLTVVPATTSAKEVLAMNPDGIFLSNGPGDPEPCDYAINAITEILETDIPIFGICLGHQLLSLASGAKTEKMKFGHHGANHPVQNLKTSAVAITSQNHGFAVAPDSLPDNVKVTHRSLFDKSIQGIERTDKSAFSFQGHPEASPGPHDISPLFDQFIDNIKTYLNNLK